MIERKSNKENAIIREHAGKIVNAIALCNYAQVADLVDDMKNWDTEFLAQVIENHKQDNDYSHIDAYEVECCYNPTYANGAKYRQESVFAFDSGTAYGYEYELTTDGFPNDLILGLKFEIVDDTKLKVIFDAGITM